MAWYPDLSPFSYHRARPTDPPTRNVGWLGRSAAFLTGDVPAELLSRLRVLTEHSRTRLLRGEHSRELCPEGVHNDAHAPSPRSTAAHDTGEIRAVGADATRDAAPTLLCAACACEYDRPPART